MTLQNLLAFSAVAALAIASPGPAVLLTLRNGATRGARSVLWSALGNISGVCCLSLAAILGLGVILKSSALLFSATKLAGAAYLLYVGVRHLLGHAAALPAATSAVTRAARVAPRDLYREGFLIAATNPKAILFFTALFPQFIDPAAPTAPQFLVLTATFMSISYASHLGYALLARRAQHVLARPAFATWLNRVVGAVFIFFATLLLTLQRRAL
jgi:threonine/homoserine/homoserine lactone efflux protein